MFKAGNVLARQIENPPHIGLFLWRHGEDAAEDFEFLLGGDAIGLGHLAGQRDHRDGESDPGIGFTVEDEMPRQRANQRAHRTADKQPGGGAD